MSARARKVSFGADSVEEEIVRKKAKLIIISIEASDRTKEKFEKLCKEYKIPVVIYGKIDELSKAIGKENKAVFAIKDVNLANEIKKIYNGGEVIG